MGRGNVTLRVLDEDEAPSKMVELGQITNVPRTDSVTIPLSAPLLRLLPTLPSYCLLQQTCIALCTSINEAIDK